MNFNKENSKNFSKPEQSIDRLILTMKSDEFSFPKKHMKESF